MDLNIFYQMLIQKKTKLVLFHGIKAIVNLQIYYYQFITNGGNGSLEVRDVP